MSYRTTPFSHDRGRTAASCHLAQRLVLAALALLSSAGAQRGEERPALDLFGSSEWVIDGLVVNGEDVSLSAAAPTNLVLLVDLPALSGTAGCNKMTAQFEIRPQSGEIQFEPITATLMACPEPAMAQERQVFEALEAVTRYERDRGRVVLSGPATEVVLVARAPSEAGATPPRQLELDAFNGAVAAAAGAGASWPDDPLRVALAFIELSGAPHTTITTSAADHDGAEPLNLEGLDSLVVMVVESGLLDDSVVGVTQRLTLERAERHWLVLGHETVWQCARGPQAEVVEPLRCP